jgi:hypothetical protein
MPKKAKTKRTDYYDIELKPPYERPKRPRKVKRRKVS